MSAPEFPDGRFMTLLYIPLYYYLNCVFSQIIAVLNSDSEGDDPAPFVVDASLVQGWQAPNAAGTSAFQVQYYIAITS